MDELTTEQTSKPPRGLAAMTPERRREIAAMGGRAVHAQGKAHRYTPDEARAAGRKGGVIISQDREHMAELGRRGGAKVSADREHMVAMGRKGGAVIAAREGHMARIAAAGGRASRRRGAERQR